MLGNRKEKNGNKRATGMNQANLNLIAQGTEIQGDLRTKSELRIEGRIKGHVIAEGKVVVAKGGEIEGEMRAASADIAGHIKGQVLIQDRLLLKSTAHIEGDIRTRKLIVEEGAMFTGQCIMGEEKPLRQHESASVKKASA